MTPHVTSHAAMIASAWILDISAAPPAGLLKVSTVRSDHVISTPELSLVSRARLCGRPKNSLVTFRDHCRNVGRANQMASCIL